MMTKSSLSSTAAAFLLLSLAAACGPGSATAPTVLSNTPARDAIGVALEGSLTATFSKAMDPATITSVTVTLKQASTAIAGAVTYSGVTATFDPNAALTANAAYTATISIGAKDKAGNPLAASYDWSFTTRSAPDTAAPSVSSTVPLNAAIAVAIGGNIAATFSEAMDPATITASTLTLKQATTPVAGAVAYAGVTATFNPTAALAASTIYTASISTGAKDVAGNALPASYSWTFTTGSAPDTTPPSVSSTVPLNAATDVGLGSSIAVTFSEAMDPLTVTQSTLTLKEGATALVGTVTFIGVTATFNPASALAANTAYAASITTGARDLAGNALAASYGWSFTTGAAPDTQAPTVQSTNPMDGKLAVVVNRSITATFSEAMDPTTLTLATFTLAGPGTTSVGGAVNYSGARATFSPLADLAPDTLFHAVITTGMKDLAGNALASDYAWSFTTGAGTSAGPAPVLLGMAGDFVILAKSGIDTVPSSAITGDIGVSPAAATYITGFSLTADSTNVFSTSPQVVGKVYAADYTSPTPSNMTTSVSDMETAYTDAAGRPTPDYTELGSGEIGGMTLSPGLYKWGTDVLITTDVTLDGGPNDVWIFQISGGVTEANGARVTLSGGALAKNIFWQTFGQLNIGTTAHFEGIALCQTAITLGTGATVNGRLLAQTAVSLDQNAVTQPAL